MNFEDIRKKHGIGTKDKETTDKTEDKTTTKPTGGSLSYSDIAKKHGISYDVDDTFINTFISDANSFISADDDSSFSTWNKLGLGSRVDTVRGWLYHNKSKFDEETYRSLSDTVDSFIKLKDYYSQFESEEDYKKGSIGWLNTDAETTSETAKARQEYYQGNKGRIADIDDELPWYAKTWLPNFVEDIFLSKDKEALRDEAEALEAENKRYDRTQRALDENYIPITDEVEQKASNRNYTNASRDVLLNYNLEEQNIYHLLNDGGGTFDEDGNIINSYNGKIIYSATDLSKAIAHNDVDGFYNSVATDKLGMFLQAVEDGTMMNYVGELSATNGNYTNTWGNIMQEGDTSGWRYLDTDEITIYYYKYATEGQASAYKFLEDMTTELTRRETEERAKEISGASLLEQLALNIASIPMSVFGGVAGLVDNASNILQGEDINPYSRAHMFSNDASAIRTDTAQDINKLTGNATLPWVGTTFGDVYQSIMSFGDSALASTIPGGYALLGMNAATTEMKDLYERGASTEQMLAGGILAGAAEMVFEKISIGELKKLKNMDAKAVKNWFEVFVRGTIMGGVEASEEMATEIANTITDALVMGSQTDWVDFETFAKNVVNAGIGGFISGGLGGSIAAKINNAQYNAKTKEHGQAIIDNGGTDYLKQLALEMSGVSQGTDSKKLANLAGKVDKKASAKNVGKLSAQMENTITKQNHTDIQNALVEKGLSEKDAKRVSEYLGSTQALTAEQKAEVEGNESIKAVVTELLDNSKSNISERGRNLLAARLGIDTKNANVNASESGKLSLRNDVDIKERISETGKTTITTTDENGKSVDVEVTIDKKNPIAKVKYVNDERIVYLNTDQGIVEASKIKYANKEEGLLYEAFVDMNPAFANAVIKNYDGSVPIQTYINGMREGMILYGMHNFQAVGKDISKNSFLADLSEADQAFALKLGKAYAKADAKKADTKLRTAIKNAADKAKASEGASTTEATQNKLKKGKVRFEEGAKIETHKQHRKIVSLAKVLASSIGIDIVFYDSKTTTNKHGKGANGYFDEDTDTIYLDLQNAKDDAKTIAFTLSHELVHFIKKWSPQKYNKFAEFLMEQYASHGVSASTLLKQKMVELNTTDADLAYEEMICDACETMLLDSNAVVKLMELRKSDLELFEKIKLHVLKILNDIREAYKKLGYQPTSDEAKALLGMKDVLEQFYSLFEEAAVDATKTYQATENANKTIFGEASVDMGKTESGVKHQLKAHKEIGEASIAYNDRHKAVHNAILKVGVESMYEMAEVMLPYLEEEGILPPDIPGKTIFKNGSYGKTGENTTLCVRTLTYEDFKDRVAEELGRPLTVSESLLVSQKIYDIATEPQCIYCYVAADRKAYDEYLGEYWKAMDKYIKAMRKGGDTEALYTEYLAGRKDTNQQRKRWSQWEAIAKSGKEYISAKDLTTKRKRDGIIARKNAFSEQIKDAQRYAQSASWAKTVCDYRAYKGDILKMTSKFVDMLNSEYGLRMYSFSDYTPAFIVENMQMIIDASVKGLKSLAYTKDTDYVEIFASTGQAINVSCFAKWDAEKGTYVEDNRQGANWEKTKSLRKQYRNVGAVMVATNDAMVEWALKQDWVDVVIPYHIVKTGTTIANEYQWNNYTSESADKMGNRAANIYPTEHNNDFATYSNLLKEREITPRFSRWYDKVASGELTEDQYMKLVNEVRLPASELSPVIPSFNIDAAKKSFGIDNEGNVIKGGFVDKGGYMGGWYRQGVDVNQEVMAVSEDIKAGKSSLDVDYGMSKTAKEKVEQRFKRQAKKVMPGMSDADRYSVLKDAKIIAISDLKSKEQPLYSEIEKIPEKAKGQIEKLIKDLADALEILNVPLSTAALDIEFQLSKNKGLRESLSQQLKYGGNFHDFAKALINLQDILERAVLIEVHTEDRYKGTDREDASFEAGYVLFSAFKTQEYVIPVKLEIKQKKDVHNILYVVVSMTKIKRISVMESAIDDNDVSTIPLSGTDSVYSLSHLASKVNPQDRHFLKYLPNPMLSVEQQEAKNIALEEDKRKLDAIPKKADSVKKQLKKSASAQYAPTFYSQMSKVIDDIKMDKIGANSLVNYLKGKGIKHDEIKWSGIEAFLEGKKSVTKAELQEFVVGSQLEIVEQMPGETTYVDEDLHSYTETEFKEMAYEIAEYKGYEKADVSFENFGEGLVAYVGRHIEENEILSAEKEEGGVRWEKYKLDGGTNYREIVFQMPNSSYSNAAMEAHWGDEAEGVLAHARIQDMTTSDGKKMLFIEELQSDWHNEGAKTGYADSEDEAHIKQMEAEAQDAFLKVEDYSVEMTGLAGEWEAIEKTEKGAKLLRKHREAQDAYFKALDKSLKKIPDAPFRDTYHEYVLKRLLRMAAEEGYDSIGWTPAYIQSKRWSDEFAEGYRIEYDQEMPKFLRKYGKKWGATVGKTAIAKETVEGRERLLKETELENVKRDIESAKRELARHYDSYEKALIQRSIDSMEKTVANLEQELSASLSVWSMDITESMEQSVLYEGQPKFQKKKLSNRTVLANTLESAIDTSTQAGQSELKWLKDYQEKIALIEKEEAHLAEVNAEIKDISFTKGSDRSKLKGLNEEKMRTANRINTYDKQLLRLEAMKPIKDVLAREKELVRKRTEAKGREALDAYREKMTKTQRELLTRYKEQRKEQRERATERRDKTTLRRKIRKLVKELNSLFKNGTKKKNIKEEMKSAVASSLALADVLFNDDIKNEDIVRLGVASVTTKESEYLNKYRDLLDVRDSLRAEIESIYANGVVRETILADVGKVQEKLDKVNGQIAYLNNKLSDLFERERARLNKTTVDAIIDDIVREYSKLKDSENGYIKNAYSEAMEKRLGTLKEALQGAIAKDMDVYQLQELYDTFKAIEHMIRYSNSLFRDGRTEDLMTYVSNVQGEIYEASTEQKDRSLATEKIVGMLNEFSWNNLRPVDAVERLGSETFEKLFWDFVHAMGTAARDIVEAGEVIASAREKFGYSKWNMELADTTFTTRDGLKFKPSLADKLSIYAYSQRDQAEDHMVDGGFTYDTGRTYKETKNGKTYVRRKLSNTYRLSKENIQAIKDSLTNEQRGYVNTILPYLTDMGKKGNEVSMTLYGIELFGEKVYFPLQSSRDYLSSTTQTLGATPTMASLANSGFTKQTKPHASNPIVLRGFDDVVLEHIEKMSNYHALVIPIENLRRVFDNVGREMEGMPISTKALIGSRFGVEAQKYFEQWLTDINGGVTPSGAKSILGKLFSRAKGTSVAANLSVVAQQYFSIIRAMEVVTPKYFTPFLNGDAKKTDMKQYEELLKYAPIAIIKEMGGFDVGSGGRTKDYIGYEGARKDAKYIKKKVDDFWMAGASAMDKLGWITIWKAVKAEVASEQKLAPGTDEFYEACRVRFTEVVTKTQVFDSVASRSGYMRSQHDAVKYATSFMGEPTAIAGRYFVAGLNLVRAIKSKDGAKIKSAALRLGRVATVVAVSNVLGKLAQSLIYGGRDDDEDEALLERWMRNFGEALAEDLKPYGFASYLPFGRDFVSLLEGYSVERPDMQLIEDVVKSFKKVTDGDLTFDDSLNLVGSVGNFFGQPLKNIIREIKSAINVVGDVFDDIHPTDIGGAFAEGFTGDERSKTEMLYDSIMSGDTERVNVIKATYKTDTAYTSALRTALTENDSRIAEAVMAHYEGDVKKRASLTLEIEKEGNFSQNIVRGAINNEITRLGNKIKAALKAKETDTAEYKKAIKELREMYPKDFVEKMLKDTIVEEEEETEDKVIGLYKMDDYFDSITRGNISTANTVKEDIIKTDIANGKDRDEAEADFNSKFTSYLREKYEDGDLSDYEAEDMLVNYAGKSEEDASSKVQYWDFKQDYPDYDLSEDAVKKYYSEIESSGISIDVYYDYTKQRAKCKGTDANGDGKIDSGSVKREALYVINSLPITSYQKDALYYLNGWSASTLWEAPWH